MYSPCVHVHASVLWLHVLYMHGGSASGSPLESGVFIAAIFDKLASMYQTSSIAIVDAHCCTV